MDKSKFPDMKAMTDHAHKLGLRMGWYGNNCICNEHQHVPSWGPSPGGGSNQFDGVKHYQGDVKATVDFGFDGIKLDGCGGFRNLSYYAELFNATGRKVLIEDCHWGGDGPGDWGDGGDLNRGPNAVPAQSWLPSNFFRTSGDIGPSWNRVFGNLQSVTKWQPWASENNTSGVVVTGPGRFAYPDMLEVGNLKNSAMDRAHFAAWCVVSSPLILGHDLTNNDTQDRVWPTITNKRAISISQSFAEGSRSHPGGLVRSWTPSGPPGNNSGTTLYAWADASNTTTDLWSFDKGMVRFVPKNVCIDAGSGQTNDVIQLKPCNPSSDNQKFVLEANGNLHMAGGTKNCIAIHNIVGNYPVWYSCNTNNGNEQFKIVDGTLCSDNGYCLQAKASSPGGGGGGGGMQSLQLWAKPQPAGGTAVLVLNHNDPDDTTQGNLTATFSFAEVGFTPIAGSSKITNVWSGKSVPLSGTNFTTDAFGGYDSRFYLLEQ